MKRKEYFLLYLISTLFFSIITLIIRDPGYMDAEYYYAGGIQIYSGNWGIEPFIWNYLNQPQSVFSPSFAYWMPFTSLLAAGGMALLGSTGFYAARLLFVLLAGTIPLFSAWYATRYFPSKGSGWLAGCSALFCVYYLPYLITTDSFTPIIVMGGAFILLSSKIWEEKTKEKYSLWRPLLLGILAGLFHLTRADGVLWLVVGLIVLILSSKYGNKEKSIGRTLLLPGIVFIVGYLLVMSGWFTRNLMVFQTILPPGNGKMIWAIHYDDLFFYRTSSITPQRFINAGIGTILMDRLDALWSNIKSLLGVNGSVVLVPIIAMGIWKTRKHFTTRLTSGVMLAALFIMSFIFPYAGYRGGFFHSNSAVQAVLWGLVPIGLYGFIELGVKYRKWIVERSWKMFGAALIAALTILTMVIFTQKINAGSSEGWNETLQSFATIDEAIIKITNDEDSVIMVNDPPGYYLATNRVAIVNPSDGIDELLAAADQYNARFTMIDQNNSKLNQDLDSNAQINQRLSLIFKNDSVEIYEILE